MAFKKSLKDKETAAKKKEADLEKEKQDAAAKLKKSSRAHFSVMHLALKDGIVLSSVGLAIFLFMALFSYSSLDAGFESAGLGEVVHNYGGKTGAWLASFVLYLFGFFGFLISLGLFMAVGVTLKIRVGSEADYARFVLSLIGLGLFILSGAGLAALYLDPTNGLITLPYSGGGVMGYEFSLMLVESVDLLGATIILLIISALSFSLLTSFTWLTILEGTGAFAYKLYFALLERFPGIKNIKPPKINLSAFKTVPSKKSELAQVDSKNSTTAQESIKKTASSKARVSSGDSNASSGLSGKTIAKLVAKKKILSVFGKKSKEKEGLHADVNVNDVESRDDFSPSFGDGVVTKKEPKEPSVSMSASTKSDAPKENVNSSEPESDFSVGARVVSNTTVPVAKSGDLPSVELLEPVPEYTESFTEEALKNMGMLLETSLKDFGIVAKVESVQPGPVVTRFEISPAPGIKVSRITGLSKDLARVLSVSSVRVVDVIAGKTFVGIEIPNDEREMVSFREIISSDIFQNSESPLTIGLGKDISGKPVIADISKMPHLLVAGTTGAGKSVGINSMILSMLFKATPEEVRLIMVDPKMVELSIYEDIPHLLTPVVTDMNDAANALRWAVFEMERRYKLLTKVGVRSIAGYNAKIKGAIEDGKPIIDPFYQQAKSAGIDIGDKPPTLAPLPFIVIIVDEFADMISVVGKEVEQLIQRIAQKARAVGIHLVLATQRPSVDVITGLIKANIPTRIAFMVNTKIDSRTVLDQGGAEQLLGMGDMLFMPPGMGTPQRVHGAFMSDEDVHRVAEFVKSQGKPQYLEAVTKPPGASSGEEENGDAEQDKLYDEVVEFAVEGRKVSVSLVQRRFRVGYNRAARLVEAMEMAGIVSNIGSKGIREVLVPAPSAELGEE